MKQIAQLLQEIVVQQLRPAEQTALPNQRD